MANILLIIIIVFWVALIAVLIANKSSWKPEAIVGIMVINLTLISIGILKETSVPPWMGPAVIIIAQVIIGIRLYRKGNQS